MQKYFSAGRVNEYIHTNKRVSQIDGTQTGYTADVDPLLAQCWSTVCDAGPTLTKQWVSASYQLGIRPVRAINKLLFYFLHTWFIAGMEYVYIYAVTVQQLYKHNPGQSENNESAAADRTGIVQVVIISMIKRFNLGSQPEPYFFRIKPE